jgi:outer membrane biosynthesis protein TonB
MRQYKLFCGVVALVSLSACSILPGRSSTPAPVPGSPANSGNANNGAAGGVLSGVLGRRAEPGQIGQCFSKNARDATIAYPAGWASRAETEDELLGGGSETLSAENAFAKPASGTVSFIYPQAALNPPIEGVCEVKFDLSRRGDASNIVSACSSDLFLEAATQAVAATKFTPVRLNGSAAKAVNMTYNMKFCLAD